MADDLSKYEALAKNKKFWTAFEKQMSEALEPIFVKLFLAGANAAHKLAKDSATKAEQPALDLPPRFDFNDLDDIAEAAMRKYSGAVAGELADTTQKQIGEAVIRARRDGTGSAGVLRSIEHLFSPARAKAIAVTETTRLFGRGAQATYTALGASGWEWQTVEDDLVDEVCEALDGKQFDMDETFEPAHVNCRCFPRPVITLGDIEDSGIAA